MKVVYALISNYKLQCEVQWCVVLAIYIVLVTMLFKVEHTGLYIYVKAKLVDCFCNSIFWKAGMLEIHTLRQKI